jgi:chromosome segregation ATPase
LIKPEDFPSDELFIKLQDRPGYNTKRRIGDGESDVEFTHLLIQIPEGTPVEKWPDFVKMLKLSQPNEWYKKGKGGGRYTPTVHIGDCFVAASGTHVSQDGKSAHFHMIVGSRTLNNKNYYGIDHNDQPIILPNNPDWRSITRRSLLGSEAEWRELKRKRINDALEALGLPKTHWLNKDEKMDESKAKAKDALQDAIKDEEQEELNSELENLKISKELAVKEFSDKDIQDAELHKSIISGQKLLADISKRAEEKLAEAYREIELVNITRSSVENAIALATIKQKLTSTEQLLETTEATLKAEAESREAFEKQLNDTNVVLEKLKEEHENLKTNYTEITTQYDELDTLYSTTVAKHEVEITNLTTKHTTEITAKNRDEKSLSLLMKESFRNKNCLEDALENQQKTFDNLLADKEEEIKQLKTTHGNELKELNAIIVSKDTNIADLERKNTELENNLATLKTEKDKQRKDFDDLIEKLKQGHLEAIEALKASNKSLTDEITKQVADVSKLKKEKEQLQTENNGLNEQLKSVQKEIEELKSDKAKLEVDNKDLNDALKVYEDDNKQRLEQAKDNKKDNNPDPKKPKNK